MPESNSNPLRVPAWHRQTSDALSRRDRHALRRLRREVRWAITNMHGRELFEACALLARVEAGLRFLPRRFLLRRSRRHV